MMPYLMKFAKKKKVKIKIKFPKNKGYFFGQHLLIEKSPTATDTLSLYSNCVIA